MFDIHRLLNEQHVAAGASPDFLYRSMIVQALSLCPTNDDVVRMSLDLLQDENVKSNDFSSVASAC